MAELYNQKNNTEQNLIQKKRWEKILELPFYTEIYSLDNNKKYTVGQFTPLHTDNSNNVLWFGVNKYTDNDVIKFEEEIYVPFLRKVGDFIHCSIVQQPKGNDTEERKTSFKSNWKAS